MKRFLTPIDRFLRRFDLYGHLRRIGKRKPLPDYFKDHDLYGHPTPGTPPPFPAPMPEYFETHDLYGHDKQRPKPKPAILRHVHGVIICVNLVLFMVSMARVATLDAGPLKIPWYSKILAAMQQSAGIYNPILPDGSVINPGVINGTIVADGTRVTLAQAIAKCPAGTGGCRIFVSGNQTFTSQILWNQNQDPLEIDCAAPSAVNGNPGGTTLTYSPAAFSTTGIDAAIFVNTLTRIVVNNCNITQGNTTKQTACTLTTIVGNGSVATANYANCTYFKGQLVNIASNTNAGFNGPQMITGVTGTTSFTFVNPTNATGNNGTAQAGVAGVYLKGSQGGTMDSVQIFGFTGAGLVITDDPNPSSGEYNLFKNLHLRQNTIGLALSQLWVGGGGGSVSGNQFDQGAIAGNTLMNVYTSGVASENGFNAVDMSDTTNLLGIVNQFGDGVTGCRGPFISAGTIESVGPASQIGYKTFCTMGVFDTEGGLTGTTPTIVKAAGSGSYILYKHGSFGVSGFDASVCPAGNWTEINTPNYKLDCNGNVGLSASPLSGTTPSINGTNGWGLCNSGSCPAQVNSTNFQVKLLTTTTNCAVNSVSPAACGAAPSGAFVVPTTTTTYTVNTTAVTANSVIHITPRTYTGNLPSAPTCVVPTITAEPVVSAISANTSFTITMTSTAGQTCWNYWVVN